MLKALCLAVLLIAPIVLSQDSENVVPLNFVGNRNNNPSCGNINNLINSVNNNVASVQGRIRGVNGALQFLYRQLSSLRRYCQVRRPTQATRRNIQDIYNSVNRRTQPLLDDSNQRRNFNFNPYNNAWRRNSITSVCFNVYDQIQSLISYFQWLGPALQSYYLGPDGVLTVQLNDLNAYKNTCLCPGRNNLCIVGATWGTEEVTDLVQRLVSGQSLYLQASDNPLPSNTQPNGYARSLVVTYQQGNNKPQVAIAKEGDVLYIAPNNGGQSWNGPSGPLTILGAAWGLADITPILAGRVSNGQLSVNPSTSSFSDSWENVQKTMVITYKDRTGIYTEDYIEVYDGTTYTIN